MICFARNLATLNEVRSMYVTKHHKYNLLDFCYIQNADSITAVRIGQNSVLV